MAIKRLYETAEVMVPNRVCQVLPNGKIKNFKSSNMSDAGTTPAAIVTNSSLYEVRVDGPNAFTIVPANVPNYFAIVFKTLDNGGSLYRLKYSLVKKNVDNSLTLVKTADLYTSANLVINKIFVLTSGNFAVSMRDNTLGAGYKEFVKIYSVSSTTIIETAGYMSLTNVDNPTVGFTIFGPDQFLLYWVEAITGTSNLRQNLKIIRLNAVLAVQGITTIEISINVSNPRITGVKTEYSAVFSTSDNMYHSYDNTINATRTDLSVIALNGSNLEIKSSPHSKVHRSGLQYCTYIEDHVLFGLGVSSVLLATNGRASTFAKPKIGGSEGLWILKVKNGEIVDESLISPISATINTQIDGAYRKMNDGRYMVSGFGIMMHGMILDGDVITRNSYNHGTGTYGAVAMISETHAIAVHSTGAANNITVNVRCVEVKDQNGIGNVLGIVTDTIGNVTILGEVSGFTGLVKGKRYTYNTTDGSIIPAPFGKKGEFIAKDSTTLIIDTLL